jgi:hypothetical protein
VHRLHPDHLVRRVNPQALVLGPDQDATENPNLGAATRTALLAWALTVHHVWLGLREILAAQDVIAGGVRPVHQVHSVTLMELHAQHVSLATELRAKRCPEKVGPGRTLDQVAPGLAQTDRAAEVANVGVAGEAASRRAQARDHRLTARVARGRAEQSNSWGVKRLVFIIQGLTLVTFVTNFVV